MQNFSVIKFNKTPKKPCKRHIICIRGEGLLSLTQTGIQKERSTQGTMARRAQFWKPVLFPEFVMFWAVAFRVVVPGNVVVTVLSKPAVAKVRIQGVRVNHLKTLKGFFIVGKMIGYPPLTISISVKKLLGEGMSPFLKTYSTSA